LHAGAVTKPPRLFAFPSPLPNPPLGPAPFIHAAMTLSPDYLSRRRGELDRSMATRGGPRYRVLGRASGPDRMHFAVWGEFEAKIRAREVATQPRQSPVVVIDAQRPREVTFYFADGGVCTVLTGRNLGLSKNTVMDIVKRADATQ